ncbi:MAG TPA: hypothetical protein VJ302_18845 [Blastocatellia bacterium]|nr:hypothetical protein [Blastocatellia bacterium]
MIIPNPTLLAAWSAIDWSHVQSWAFYYTDPGSGALLWQLVLASFFGGLFYFRSFIRKIRTLIQGGDQQRIRQPQTPAQTESTTSQHKTETGG